MKTFRIALIACIVSASAWADGETPALWKAKCASCHGEDGKAQTKQGKKHKIDDMTAADWQTNWTDEKMKQIILDGSKDKKEMKAFKGKISDAEIDGLIKHIRAFKS